MNVNELSPDLVERMNREMETRPGEVPASITGSFFSDESFAISGSEFIFDTLDGVRFHYQLGKGLVVQMPADAAVRGIGSLAETDYELFLWGTVFGAVAWLNGLVPLHASAVDVGGRIVAFTADSGGGKSTLAAGLARLGLPHVCDDTLVVSVGERVVAMPDAKPLKLWGDALALTATEAIRPVLSMPGKHYASPETKAASALPLTDLYFLEVGESVEAEPVTGSEKLTLLPWALYRNFVHTARGDRAAHERFLMSFCSQVRFWRLRRPFDPASFSTDLLKIKDIVASE